MSSVALYERLTDFLEKGKTAYHAAAEAASFLEEHGYRRLSEGTPFSLAAGGKYYVTRNGSSVIAFSVGNKCGGFRIVGAHLDSPALKIKGNPVIKAEGASKLNTEPYGGGLYYSWLDIPLQVAGRAVIEKDDGLHVMCVTGEKTLVIPSLAIHMQRDANKSLSVNPQIDLQPILSLSTDARLACCEEGRVMGEDLFLVHAAKPYFAGLSEELLVAPRIDDLVSAMAVLEAMEAAGDTGVSVAFLADNEEIGSRTKQGAASDFLSSVLTRIAESLSFDLRAMLKDSCFVSCDNAHAVHPNHPEKSDPTNRVHLGGGIVIKHHAGGNYTTDAVSASIFKSILEKKSIPYQEFFMRSDMPCGGTLGAISSMSVSIPSIDIGIAQLAMHAATETMAIADYSALVDGLSAFYRTAITVEDDGMIRLSE